MPEKPTKLARERAGRTLARMRWAGTTAKERSKFASEIAAHRTPEQMGAARRDPSKPRCPCGKMTLKRAQAHRHKCEAPLQPIYGKRTLQPPFSCCHVTWQTVEEWRAHASPDCQPIPVPRSAK